MFGRKESVEEWFETQSDQIANALRKGRERALGWDPTDLTLDASTRTLPEMELCGALALLSLPIGFSLKDGIVTVVGKVPYRQHVFAYHSKRDEVFDPLAPQFFFRKGHQRGEVESWLVCQAPELFLVSGEVSVLYGNRYAIQAKLGMIYAY